MPILNMLRNPVWESLEGAHVPLKKGCALASRYPGNVVPLAAVRDSERASLDALAELLLPGEDFYFFGDNLRGHPAFGTEWTSLAVQMMFENRGPSGAPPLAGMRALTLADSPAMVELARVSENDYFRAETMNMGEFIGIFEKDNLVAMAGERLCLGRWREIAAVCTHPSIRGRGFAAQLVLELCARASARGENSFLHVDSSNTIARTLYKKIGFVEAGTINIQYCRRK